MSRTRRNVRKLAVEEQAKKPGVMTAFREVMQEVGGGSLPHNLYEAFADFYGKATQRGFTDDAFRSLSVITECPTKLILGAGGVFAAVGYDDFIHAFFPAFSKSGEALRQGVKKVRAENIFRENDRGTGWWRKSRHNTYTTAEGALCDITESIPHKGDFGRGTLYIPK